MTRPDAPARRRRAAAAGHLGDVEAARAALDDTDGRVRVAGLRSLDRLGQLTVDELAAALVDADSGVRIAALELAAHHPDPPVLAGLRDPDAMVVEATAWALGERADASGEVIAALADTATEHDDPLVREAAVAALGAIGDRRGLPAILAATTDKPAVRRRAVVCLAPFDGPDVDAAFARARTDRDRQVRDAVEELLGPR